MISSPFCIRTSPSVFSISLMVVDAYQAVNNTFLWAGKSLMDKQTKLTKQGQMHIWKLKKTFKKNDDRHSDMKYKETEGRWYNKVSVQLSIWCTLCRRTRANVLYQTVLLYLLQTTHTLLTVCVQCEEVLVKHVKASRWKEWDEQRMPGLKRTCVQTCRSDTWHRQQLQQ